MPTTKRIHETHSRDANDEQSNGKQKRIKLSADSELPSSHSEVITRKDDPCGASDDERLQDEATEAGGIDAITEILSEGEKIEQQSRNDQQPSLSQLAILGPEEQLIEKEIDKANEQEQAPNDATSRNDSQELIKQESKEDYGKPMVNEKHEGREFRLRKSSPVVIITQSQRRTSSRCSDMKEKRIKDLEDELLSREYTISELQSQAKTSKKREKAWEATLAAAEERYEKLGRERDMLKKRYSELKEKSQGLHTKFQIKIKDIQERVLQSRDQATWTSPSDTQIAKDLKTVDRLIKNLVKECMILNAEHFTSEFSSATSDQNPHFITQAGQAFLSETILDKATITMYLTAWVASMVYSGVFNEPLAHLDFLRIDGHTQAKADKHNRASFLLKLVSKYHGYASAEYLKLRSEIVRQLEPSLGGVQAHEGVAELEIKSQEARNQVVCQMAQQITGKITVFLKSEADGKAFEKLLGILATTARIAMTLTAQRSRILCITANGLGEHLQFSTDLDDIDYHDSHEQDLEDGELVLENKAVLLISTPMIVAVGASDGSDMDSRRVLRNAVAWMGPRTILGAMGNGEMDDPLSKARAKPTRANEDDVVRNANEELYDRTIIKISD